MPSNVNTCIDLIYSHIKETIIRNLKSIKINSFLLALLFLSYVFQNLQAASTVMDDPAPSFAGTSGTAAGGAGAKPEALEAEHGKTVTIASIPSRSMDEYAALCRASMQGKKTELAALYEIANGGDFRA